MSKRKASKPRKSLAPTAPPKPPSNLGSRALPIITITRTDPWFRIFRNDFPTPQATYFGKSGTHRFDALNREFGVMYLGDSISCSFAEVWLRNPDPKKLTLLIDANELAFRSLAKFRILQPLVLVDLVGDGLTRLGLDAGIVATRNYEITQAWSSAFHGHPDQLDGICYSSRLNLASTCIALFERSGDKVEVVREDRLKTAMGRRLIEPSFKKFDVGLM